MRLPTAMAGLLRLPGHALFARRQIDLPRWTRGRDFMNVHSAVVAWLDGFFEAVERDASWLNRVGSDAADQCRAQVPSVFELRFAAPRPHAAAGCERSVIVVYGFDGDLSERLTEIARVLAGLGWVGVESGMTKGRSGSRSSGLVHWRPTPAFGPPRGLERLPPWGNRALEPHMGVLWCSHGEEMPLRRDSLWTRGDTRNRLTLESTGSEFWKLPDLALERGRHALAMILEVGYYGNAAALERPHRLPRHLLPTRRVPR